MHLRLQPFVILCLLLSPLICCCKGQNQATEITLPASEQGLKIVEAARWQVGKTTSYDGSYVSLSYPNGDIPIETGVCTDVVIRALRKALQFDLQQKVHLDMKAHFSSYPKRWGLTRTDRNIDHRRVPNLRTYFKRHHQSLKVSKDKTSYKPGDLVTCTVSGNLPHIMVVSNHAAPDGTPLVIHNIGAGAQEENDLFTYPITGHYRLKEVQQK